MTYIKLEDVNVDGCGTDVSTIIEVDSDIITNDTIKMVTEAIEAYKRQNEGEWDSDGCFDVAAEQLKSEGFEVKFIVPITTICF